MDAHAFDVRDSDRMQLLLEGSAMSAWDLLRRYGGPLSAARVAVYLGVDEPEAQRALARLAGAGFVESLAPRGRRRQTVFAHRGSAIVVRYQDGDADDLRLLEEWRAKVRHSVAWIGRGGGRAGVAQGVTRSIRVRAHLTERDAEELLSPAARVEVPRRARARALPLQPRHLARDRTARAAPRGGARRDRVRRRWRRRRGSRRRRGGAHLALGARTRRRRGNRGGARPLRHRGAPRHHPEHGRDADEAPLPQARRPQSRRAHAAAGRPTRNGVSRPGPRGRLTLVQRIHTPSRAFHGIMSG